MSLLALPGAEVIVGRTLRSGAFAKVRPALWLCEGRPPQRLAVRETRSVPPRPRSLYARPAGRDISAQRTEFEFDDGIRCRARKLARCVPQAAGIPGAPFAVGESHKSYFELVAWRDADLFELSMQVDEAARGVLARAYLDQLLPLLAQYHQANVWLGEIKLSNVVYDASHQTMAFIDFSTSRIDAASEPAQQRREELALPPPEALDDNALLTNKTDLWALGASALELLGEFGPSVLPPVHATHPALRRFSGWYRHVAPAGQLQLERLHDGFCQPWDEWTLRAAARCPKLTTWLFATLLVPDPLARPLAVSAAASLQALQPLHDAKGVAAYTKSIVNYRSRRAEEGFFALEHARDTVLQWGREAAV